MKDQPPGQPKGLTPLMSTPGSNLGAHPPVIGLRASSTDPESSQEPSQVFNSHSHDQTATPQS